MRILAKEWKTMKKGTKSKQIVVRFDTASYEKISAVAAAEHRGLGECVRHAALLYIAGLEKEKERLDEKRGA
jgi:hypothetical protein